jgi:hypothetical protein
MCEECEQAEPLAAVYLRKANRYGWRPPVAAATAPRHDDGASYAADFVCVDAGVPKAEVDRCA